MERWAQLPESLKLHLLALVAKKQQQDERPDQLRTVALQEQQHQESHSPAEGTSASSEATSYLQDLPELPPLSTLGVALVDGF